MVIEKENKEEITLEQAKEMIMSLKQQLWEYEMLFRYITKLKTKQDFLEFRNKILQANKILKWKK